MFRQSKADFMINFPSSGSVLCSEVLSFEIEDQETVEAVSDTAGDRPSGFREVKGAIQITVTEVPGVPPQVDWYEIRSNKEVGSVTVQYRGGAKDGLRVQFTQVVVAQVGDANLNGEDGNSQREIMLLALGRQEQ